MEKEYFLIDSDNEVVGTFENLGDAKDNAAELLESREDYEYLAIAVKIYDVCLKKRAIFMEE